MHRPIFLGDVIHDSKKLVPAAEFYHTASGSTAINQTRISGSGASERETRHC
jgi:hypothetical protein